MTEERLFLLKKIRWLFHLDTAILNENRELRPEFGTPRYDTTCLAGAISIEEVHAQIIMAEENIYFGVVALPDRCTCVIGPMGGELLTAEQQWHFRMHYHVKTEDYTLDRFSHRKMSELLELACFMLTGTMCSLHTRVEDTEAEKADAEVIRNQIDNEMEARARATYASEQEFVKIVEDGDTKKMKQILLADNEQEETGQPGVVSKNSDYKQAEYIAVTGIALASRAAMRGNARPDTVYDLSDVYLQKLSAAKRVDEIYEIASQALLRFTSEVEKERLERAKNPMVEQCKNYIAKHLYSKFSIQDMAQDLAINRTYISGIFKKETGVTIQEYILEHRVRAAANMLRFSNEPIGQIVEYMQFSSAGRFSEYFRRYYSMTPEQYRQQYMVSEFKE